MQDSDQRDRPDAKRDPSAGPLAELTRHLAAQRAATPQLARMDQGAALDPQLTGYFRDTWSRVRARGQLRQSLQRVPENAGPLNSSHLLHRALTVMEQASPAYLREFLAYADALAWLEGIAPAQGAPVKDGRAAAPRKAGKAKGRKP
ncbi:DUF2894 domain-containing protein [Cupriavidus sp. AU9028]|uniref:DUF2894 domain-containing protein n=1 Tax=Cupriavidus sp. AU9028 TaxID=2871157 RepID=UPI001C98A4C2|nr:DUF2894 domain-containing protein [Cupriavidus sp. AU9028]MBY4895931.1 DUF2894 domain-containing protein [Cupriavidus sp. AU9028]